MKKCFRAVSEFKMFESSKQASWLVPPLEYSGKCCCIMMIFTGIVCDSCMLAVCVFFFLPVCVLCNSVCGMIMREESVEIMEVKP